MPTYVGDALLAHANGGCYRCARGDQLVDMDAQIVGEGALVLCKACILDAAETAGLSLNAAAVAELTAAHQEERRQFSPETVAALQADLHASQLQVTALQSVLDYLTAPATSEPAES